jgi:hypothetical protein
MGTSTIYKRMNDLGMSFKSMSQKDLDELEKLSPYGEEKVYRGWTCPMELHNGNIYFLVSWKGRLMRLDQAPKILNKKYYHKYSGKTLNEYEWTRLKTLIINEVNNLDNEFKKSLRRK